MKLSLPTFTALLLAAAAASFAAAPVAQNFEEAIALGKVSLNARLRYESVTQTGLRDASAFTLRTRLGFTTAPLSGWQAMLEAENITAANPDGYNQAGLNPGGAGRAVIADPTGTEINQAFLSYKNDQTTAILGRQRFVLDNHRFIGDVGFRQNLQTFDALVVQDKSLDKTTLTYAYLWRINRIFSSRHPQGVFDSNSHVLNAAYTGLTAGTLTGYAYLLDFDNSRANSCATYGASFVGTTKLTDAVKFSYRAEYATQSNYGSSPLNYQANYSWLEAGLVFPQVSFALAQEILGSDNNVGFKTPLATLHPHNGWADLFLATPAAGLRDTSLKFTANLPEKISLLAYWHDFNTDRGNTNLGRELDVQLSRKFGKFTTGLVKYADFQRDSLTFPDVRKIWVQVEFVY